MSRLDQLYKAMQTLNSECLVLNEDLLNQVSELEEKIIKEDYYNNSNEISRSTNFKYDKRSNVVYEEELDYDDM